MKRILAALSIVALAARSGFAQDEATPRAALEVTDANATLTLHPFLCEPEDHCVDIQFICTDGSLEMWLRNLLAQHGERWLQGNDTATVYTDTGGLLFRLQRFTEREGWGWVARLAPTDDFAPLLSAMAQSVEIDVITPFYTFVVMPAPADAETMTSFNDACGVLAPAAP